MGRQTQADDADKFAASIRPMIEAIKAAETSGSERSLAFSMTEASAPRAEVAGMRQQ